MTRPSSWPALSCTALALIFGAFAAADFDGQHRSWLFPAVLGAMWALLAVAFAWRYKAMTQPCDCEKCGRAARRDGTELHRATDRERGGRS